jgi:hypothetical protein
MSLHSLLLNATLRRLLRVLALFDAKVSTQPGAVARASGSAVRIGYVYYESERRDPDAHGTIAMGALSDFHFDW